MGRLSGSVGYAVYCGRGVYVGAVALDEKKEVVIEVASESGAAVVSRARAVGMLHAVRGLGFSAWLVRPAGASA